MAANNIEISQFLDYVGVIIVVIGPDQKVSYINKKGCEILGYEKEDILGKNWFDNFLPGKIREDIKTVFAKLIGQEIELAEYFDNVVLTKDDQERLIGWHNIVLKNDAGTIVGTLSWGEDITERRRNDRNRENLVQELKDRVTELKSMKMNIPICSLEKKDLNESMKKHYRLISKEGKCSECLHVLKMVSQIKK
jgi:PAS domain S-box-containing protein